MAIIDREINRSNRKSKKFISLFLMIILALSLITISFLKLQESESDPLKSPALVRILYSVHDPIYIEGNSNFTNASGVVWGSGTSEDPYIIADWDINASSANGIEIRSTTAHFIIRNCYIHDGRWNYYGIFLYEAVNGTLIDNTCSNNHDGISLSSSSNNTISNNTCSSNNYFGIVLVSSSDNAISNNTCSSNSDGISLSSWSDNNTISNNTCSNNHAGISLRSSSNNTLRENILNEDGIMIRGSKLFHFNTHDIDTSNLVNGKPAYYYKDQSGMTVPSGAGQVILANCTNFVIENENLSNTYIGIALGFSSFTLIANNTCSSNNCDGIWLSSSNNNTISNNTCSSNNYDGIYLRSSSNNTISNNTCSSNNYFGIVLVSSSDNVISNNTCSSNNRDGISLSSWSDNNAISNNTCSSNNYHGISLYLSSNNTIAWNLICNNSAYGAEFYFYSNNNVIWNNTFIDNNGAGSIYDPSHIQAYDDSTDNWWNSTEGYGNYWSDWTTPDNDFDGIVDIPYNISGGAGAKDYYPQTTMPVIPEPSVFILAGIMIAIFLLFGRTRKKK